MRSRWEVPIPSPMKMMTFFARSSVDATPWAPPAPARAPHAMALTITDNTATTRLPRTMLDAPSLAPLYAQVWMVLRLGARFLSGTQQSAKKARTRTVVPCVVAYVRAMVIGEFVLVAADVPNGDHMAEGEG